MRRSQSCRAMGEELGGASNGERGASERARVWKGLGVFEE